MKIDAGKGYRLLGPNERPDLRNGVQVTVNAGFSWLSTSLMGEYTCDKYLQKWPDDKMAWRIPCKTKKTNKLTSSQALEKMREIYDGLCGSQHESLKKIHEKVISMANKVAFERRHKADVREFVAKCKKGGKK